MVFGGGGEDARGSTLRLGRELWVADVLGPLGAAVDLSPSGGYFRLAT